MVTECTAVGVGALKDGGPRQARAEPGGALDTAGTLEGHLQDRDGLGPELAQAAVAVDAPVPRSHCARAAAPYRAEMSMSRPRSTP